MTVGLAARALTRESDTINVQYSYESSRLSSLILWLIALTKELALVKQRKAVAIVAVPSGYSYNTCIHSECMAFYIDLSPFMSVFGDERGRWKTMRALHTSLQPSRKPDLYKRRYFLLLSTLATKTITFGTVRS